jgi:hypothetical protein
MRRARPFILECEPAHEHGTSANRTLRRVVDDRIGKEARREIVRGGEPGVATRRERRSRPDASQRDALRRLLPVHPLGGRIIPPGTA